MAISSITNVVPSSATVGTVTGMGSQGRPTSSFSDVLGEALDEVNGVLQQADQLAASYAAGGPTTIDQLMVAEQQASLALDLTVQTRDRIVSAYQSLMNMQI
ncbi:flagellar hook-basal body complex protein FliE [Alicyclobacillus herbarius]|uniref:flagellar hook-basal body complex protein FliE n=1 Tax=Alicyclobacillus herbarius TaxID=122960 RepID=UPI0023571C8F|nr:flagellar hook-basal body complex protein FliE [Alicyclobacillus herbarius]